MKTLLFHLLHTFGWLIERICSIGSALSLVAFLASLAAEDSLTFKVKASLLGLAVLFAAIYYYYGKLLGWLAPDPIQE